MLVRYRVTRLYTWVEIGTLPFRVAFREVTLGPGANDGCFRRLADMNYLKPDMTPGLVKWHPAITKTPL